MDSQLFIIPYIKLDKNLNSELLAVADSVEAELLNTVQLHSTDIVESTHLTRKRLKLLRAFLKLLNKCVEEDSLKQLNSTFRNWGQSISELRDVHVHRMIILDTPTDYFKKSDSKVLDKILETANQQVEQLENRLVFEDEIFKHLEHQIYNHSSLRTFLKSNNFDSECILEGYKISYRKSYRAFKRAESSKLPGPFHEWRKRLKDVQYQSALLRSNQDRINVSAQEVEQFCEALGKDQDLNNFIHWLGALNLNTKAVKEWLHHLKKSQLELKKQLIKDGNRFYKQSAV
ncbi:CHAD domain-containing protein [Rhodohalobacter sp.]|uniref:CHAD domain-containing protein n=1 Tax=Rhodohalobacter sp. TaxID=1974210 RepID=UPI002ACD367A|nr:CHAD domain-containing protein [Rhodohalobacter sp.]MDZ7755277.1 CHAD domain-containing protein [Rhodohalobacter sp.]